MGEVGGGAALEAIFSLGGVCVLRLADGLLWPVHRASFQAWLRLASQSFFWRAQRTALGELLQWPGRAKSFCDSSLMFASSWTQKQRAQNIGGSAHAPPAPMELILPWAWMSRTGLFSQAFFKYKLMVPIPGIACLLRKPQIPNIPMWDDGQQSQIAAAHFANDAHDIANDGQQSQLAAAHFANDGLHKVVVISIYIVVSAIYPKFMQNQKFL